MTASVFGMACPHFGMACPIEPWSDQGLKSMAFVFFLINNVQIVYGFSKVICFHAVEMRKLWKTRPGGLLTQRLRTKKRA